MRASTHSAPLDRQLPQQPVISSPALTSFLVTAYILRYSLEGWYIIWLFQSLEWLVNSVPSLSWISTSPSAQQKPVCRMCLSSYSSLTEYRPSLVYILFGLTSYPTTGLGSFSVSYTQYTSPLGMSSSEYIPVPCISLLRISILNKQGMPYNCMIVQPILISLIQPSVLLGRFAPRGKPRVAGRLDKRHSLVEVLSRVLGCDPLASLVALRLVLHLERNMLNLVQRSFQILLTPQSVDPYLLLPHQHPGDLLLQLRIMSACLLQLTAQPVQLLYRSEAAHAFRRVLFEPPDPLLHIDVVVAVLLKIVLKLSIVVLNYLQFFLDQQIDHVVKVSLYAFYQLEHFLLQVLLSLPRLLQLHVYFLHSRIHLESQHILFQLFQCLGLHSDHMLLAVGQSTAQTHALPAGQADVGALIEMQRTLLGAICALLVASGRCHQPRG